MEIPEVEERKRRAKKKYLAQEMPKSPYHGIPFSNYRKSKIKNSERSQRKITTLPIEEQRQLHVTIPQKLCK